jgi:hypothetical protein
LDTDNLLYTLFYSLILPEPNLVPPSRNKGRK